MMSVAINAMNRGYHQDVGDDSNDEDMEPMYSSIK